MIVGTSREVVRVGFADHQVAVTSNSALVLSSVSRKFLRDVADDTGIGGRYDRSGTGS
jgi:hypothetical protein